MTLAPKFVSQPLCNVKLTPTCTETPAYDVKLVLPVLDVSTGM